MIRINVPGKEYYDENKQEFVTVGGGTLQLEHSLVSLQKWEAKWHVPFISTEDKTIEQTVDYIKCMTITQNVKDEVYDGLTNADIEKINDYIADPHTATWFSDKGKPASHKTINNEVITAELLYYWMIALNIPSEYRKWHLNQLITLIRVCSLKNQADDKKNKLTGKDLARHNAELNAQRRAKFNSKG